MKIRELLTVFVVLLFLLSCVPKAVIQPVPEKAGTPEALFLKAEKLFQAKSYFKALNEYERYLSFFPQGTFADDALMKMGMIYVAVKKNKKARKIFNRLLSQYPDSPLAIDTRIEILITYYNEAQFAEVIQLSSSLLEGKISKVNTGRIYTILGDTYVAMDSPEDSIHFFTMAHKMSEVAQQQSIMVKMKQAVGKLDSESILSLLNYIEDKLPKGYLMYHLGVSYSKEEKPDEAIRALTEFVKSFPEHENVQQAKLLIEEIAGKAVYRRYTIGCLLPLSGPYSIYGNRAMKGIELALSQFNSIAANPSINVLIKDTGGNPDRAIVAMQDLQNDQVAAIIGPIITAEAVATEAQHSGIPMITITQKENITEISDNIFRNFITPEMQVKAVVSYAVDVLEVKNFAVLYPEEKYGTHFMNLFWDEVLKYGGRIVGAEAYNPSHTDFKDPIKKLVGLYYEVPEDLKEKMDAEQVDMEKPDAENPDDEDEEPEPVVDFEAIFIPDGPKKAGLIIPQLAFHDIEDVYLLGTKLWHSKKLVDMTKEYIQRAIIPEGFFHQSTSVKIRNFVEKFEKTYSEKPGFIEAIAYDTSMILFQILSRPDVRSRSAIKDALMQVKNFQGVTGLTSFNDTGDVKKKLSLLRIKDDQFVELEFN
ncbi:MAG: penicillin-binding protein activator [Thermodesulfobacteriota bacterium]|nr:penicillin-binding protein activator [Thermodesulfobacteriota bacterium]